MRLYYTHVSSWGALDARRLAQIEALVSPQRAARAAAMRREQDARTVLAAGLLLRHALGCTDEALLRGAHGKPYLPGGPELSLTHGGALAAILLADGPCGVDAEPLSRRPRQPERLFGAQELATGLSPAALWTRKEAVLKADGRGLLLAPASVDASGETAQCGGRTYILTTATVCSHALSCAGPQRAPAPVALTLAQLLAAAGG